MCLNTNINYEALEENYDLSPFAGLKRSSINGSFKAKLGYMDSTTSL